MGLCCGAPQIEEDSENLKHQQGNAETPERKKRAFSMQSLWTDDWLKMIEDRSKETMRKEAEMTSCSASIEDCNCVKRAIFVMKIYKFWNDRKHIELDIDHIVEVITRSLENYGSSQMMADFKHCVGCHHVDDLNEIFNLKMNGCGGNVNECGVLHRHKKAAISSDDEDEDGLTLEVDKEEEEEYRHQRTSTFSRVNLNSLKMMKILDEYHCYFLHKMNITGNHHT